MARLVTVALASCATTARSRCAGRVPGRARHLSLPDQPWPSPARRHTWSASAPAALPPSYPCVTVISPDVTFDTMADEEGVGVKFVVPSVMVPVATAARVKPTTIPFTSRPGALKCNALVKMLDF